jgi:hypothetical protein
LLKTGERREGRGEKQRENLTQIRERRALRVEKRY